MLTIARTYKHPILFCFTQSNIYGNLGNKQKYPLKHFEYLVVRVNPIHISLKTISRYSQQFVLAVKIVTFLGFRCKLVLVEYFIPFCQG